MPPIARGHYIADIVRDAPAIWKSRAVASQQTQPPARALRGGTDAGVEPEIRNGASRCSGGRDGRSVGHQEEQVRPRRRRHPNSVDGIEDTRKLWIRVQCGKLRIVLRLAHAPQVLRPGGDHQVVDERNSHAMDLGIGTAGYAREWGAANQGSGPASCGPRADGRGRIPRREQRSGPGQHADRHFNSDGVYVVTGEVIRRDVRVIVRVGGRAQDAAAGARSKIQAVEQSPEIAKIWIIHGSGEHANPVAEAENSLVRQSRIVGHGAGAHVGRNCKQRATRLIRQNGGDTALDHGHGVSAGAG